MYRMDKTKSKGRSVITRSARLSHGNISQTSVDFGSKRQRQIRTYRHQSQPFPRLASVRYCQTPVLAISDRKERRQSCWVIGCSEKRVCGLCWSKWQLCIGADSSRLRLRIIAQSTLAPTESVFHLALRSNRRIVQWVRRQDERGSETKEREIKLFSKYARQLSF